MRAGWMEKMGHPNSTESLYVFESGQVGSPAIIFLHGVGTSAGMWKEHMEWFAVFHCLAPDLPGHGRSNRVSWISRADTARQIARLIEGCTALGRAHVVGLSLGGAVAHELLAREPDVLDHVVIDGCAALPAWWVRLMKLGVAGVSPVIHRKLVISMLARGVGIDAAGRSRFADDMRAASPREFRRAFSDANDVRITREEASAPCPTLLVAGEREPNSVRASNAALADLMSNGVARFAPGHGHGWLAKLPELHCRMVEAWVNGQELPVELELETAAWSRAQVARLVGNG
jgi:pimeloyl-ACP methyl ester carboxylesterase